MKLNRLILAAVAAMFVEGAYAQQPYGGCWHPDDIKNWSPETDKDAKFNRSRVPLAKRFKEPELMKANKNQYYEGQICNAPILFPTCSMCPSQGAYNFLGYQPPTGSIWTSSFIGQVRLLRVSSSRRQQVLSTLLTRAV